MSYEEELAELSTMYHGTREYVEELERGMEDCNKKIAALEELINGLFVISEAGPVKNSLWRKYEQLKRSKPPQEPLEGISGI